jgi:hypothetical protein
VERKGNCWWAALLVAATLILVRPVQAQCWGWLWGGLCSGMPNNTYCKHCTNSMCDITCTTSEEYFYCVTLGGIFCDGLRPRDGGGGVIIADARRGNERVEVSPMTDDLKASAWKAATRLVNILLERGDRASAERLTAITALDLELVDGKRTITAAEIDALLADMEAPLAPLVRQQAADLVLDALTARRLSARQAARLERIGGAWLESAEWNLRAKGITVAASLGGPKAKAAIERLTKDPNSIVAFRARQVLDPTTPLPPIPTEPIR